MASKSNLCNSSVPGRREHMSTDLVIGIDSSTTAAKAIAFDRSGLIVAEGRAPVPLSNPLPLHFEQDPDDWWQSTCAVLRQIASAIEPERIAALAISNQRETFGLFRADGTAIRPGTVWLDERSKPQVKSLGERLGGAEIHRISGKPLDVTPCLYRCLWMAENEPQHYSAAERIAEVHGYLSFRLTGNWITSTASADPMGLLDMAAGDWSDVLLDAVGLVREQLPELVRPGQRMGGVSAEAAAATGLPAGTPVIAGGGDGQCAGTGANVLVPGRAYINFGTAVVSGNYGSSYAHDPAFRTMGAIAEDGYIYESCVRTGTFLVDWMVREMFQIVPRDNPGIFDALEQEARQSGIGARGVSLLPYWSGVMTPYWDAGARGVIAGLSASHSRGDLYRAVLEGVVLEQAMVSDQIATATASPIDHYVAIGGGAASDLWCQILADASARPVHRLETVEASALGAAMAAAAGCGFYKSIADAAAAMSGPLQRSFEPDDQAVKRYAELRTIHGGLWPALADWNTRLVEFVEGGDA